LTWQASQPETCGGSTKARAATLALLCLAQRRGLAMIIRCILFVDGKSHECILGAVPRVGELILTRTSEVVVENIKHIARGALEENPGPHVQIFAKVIPVARRVDDAPRPQEARSAPPT